MYQNYRLESNYQTGMCTFIQIYVFYFVEKWEKREEVKRGKVSLQEGGEGMMTCTSAE